MQLFHMVKNNYNQIRILTNITISIQIATRITAVARTIVAQDGFGMLYKGLGPTTVGYFIQVRTVSTVGVNTVNAYTCCIR
jgi:hypothetical protein